MPDFAASCKAISYSKACALEHNAARTCRIKHGWCKHLACYTHLQIDTMQPCIVINNNDINSKDNSMYTSLLTGTKRQAAHLWWHWTVRSPAAICSSLLCAAYRPVRGCLADALPMYLVLQHTTQQVDSMCASAVATLLSAPAQPATDASSQ